MPTDTIVWEEVRRVYDDHSIPITKICRQFGIKPSQLSKARNDLCWTPRFSATDPRRQLDRITETDDEAAAAEHERSQPAKAKRLPPIATRRAFVARLTAVIETKLAILESRFERELTASKKKRGKAVSAADAERDQRAISLIIKNLELVREYGHAPQPGIHLRGAAAKSANLAATQLADEADRIRRELGDRLSRLVEAPSSTAQGDPASA
jgi:hypothetical protein